MFPKALQRTVRALLCVLAASSACPLHAAQTWYEVRSPHFRVVTDGSEKDGRTVAMEFEQMRHVFASLFGREDFESGAPLTIVAARDANTFKNLEPALWKARGDGIAGEFHTGWEKQFATIRLDTWNDQNQVVVFHEYSHSVLHANIHWLPTWLDEGLAEYYGYSRFETNKVYVGAPSLRLRVLRSRIMFPTETILGVDDRSPLYHDEDKVQIFYGQSWAMVHYMMFGPEMDRGRKLQDFIRKLQAQEPEKQAFTEVFCDLKAFDKALFGYINNFQLSAMVLPPAAGIDPKLFSAHQLSPAEADYELACFHIGNHDRSHGEPLLDDAVRLDPKLAGPHEELGYLAFEKGDDQGARAEWQKAIDLDATLPRAHYALLMSAKPVQDQSPTELLATQTGLRHVAELAPKFAPAYVELALVEWRLGQLNQAYKDAYHGEVLAPWRAGYHTLTGDILLQGHQPAVAERSARYVAAHWFGPDHDEAVDLWNRIPAASHTDGPALALDVPTGSTVVRGTLTQVACATNPGDKLTIALQPESPADAKPLSFRVDGRFRSGWSDTLWWGSDHYSLCHHLTGLPALIAYKPGGSDGGELLDLEVRDHLPPFSSAPTAASASVLKAPPVAATTAATPSSK